MSPAWAADHQQTEDSGLLVPSLTVEELLLNILAVLFSGKVWCLHTMTLVVLIQFVDYTSGQNEQIITFISSDSRSLKYSPYHHSPLDPFLFYCLLIENTHASSAL